MSLVDKLKTRPPGDDPPDPTQLLSELAILREENAALRAQGIARPLTLKIGPKGTLCVYGLGRNPVVLYAPQWERLLSEVAVVQIKGFLKKNRAYLAQTKGGKHDAPPEELRSAGWKLVAPQPVPEPPPPKGRIAEIMKKW